MDDRSTETWGKDQISVFQQQNKIPTLAVSDYELLPGWVYSYALYKRLGR